MTEAPARTEAQRERELEIAKTIRSQIMATDAMALASWGERNKAALTEGPVTVKDIGYVLGGYTFRVANTNNVKRGGIVSIYLACNDTYIVRVCRIHGSKIIEIALVKEVYCDTLVETIDQILER